MRIVSFMIAALLAAGCGARTAPGGEATSGRVERPDLLAQAADTPAAARAAVDSAAPSSATTPATTDSPSTTVPRSVADAPSLAVTRAADPIVAARAIDTYLSWLAANPAAGDVRDVVAPGTKVWDASIEQVAPHAERSYRLQNNQGTRANVFVDDGDGRSVLTLLRWNGAWKLAAIIELQDGPPLIVIDGNP